MGINLIRSLKVFQRLILRYKCLKGLGHQIDLTLGNCMYREIPGGRGRFFNFNLVNKIRCCQKLVDFEDEQTLDRTNTLFYENEDASTVSLVTRKGKIFT